MNSVLVLVVVVAAAAAAVTAAADPPVWVQGGKREGLYRKTFDEATDGVVTTLLQSSNPSNLAYIADWDGGRLNHKVTKEEQNK